MKTDKYIGIGNNIQGKAYMRVGMTQQGAESKEQGTGNSNKRKETKGKGRA